MNPRSNPLLYCLAYFILLTGTALKLDNPAWSHLAALSFFPVLMVIALCSDHLQVLVARYFFQIGIVWAGGCFALSFTGDSIWEKWQLLAEWQGWAVFGALAAASLLPIFFALDMVDIRWRRILGCVAVAIVSMQVYPHLDGFGGPALVLGMMGLSIPALFPVVSPLSHRWAESSRPDGMPFFMVASVLGDKSDAGMHGAQVFFDKINDASLLKAIFSDSGLTGFRGDALRKINDPAFNLQVLMDTSQLERHRKAAFGSFLKSSATAAPSLQTQFEDWLAKAIKTEQGISKDFQLQIMECIKDETLLQEITADAGKAGLHLAALNKIKDIGFHRAVFADPERPLGLREVSFNKLLPLDKNGAGESRVLQVFLEKRLPSAFRLKLLGHISTPANLHTILKDSREEPLFRTLALSGLSKYDDFRSAIVSLPKNVVIPHISELNNYPFLNKFLKDKDCSPPNALNELHIAIGKHLHKNGKAQMHQTMLILVVNHLLAGLTVEELKQTLRSYITAYGEGKGFLVGETARGALAEKLTGLVPEMIGRDSTGKTVISSTNLELLWTAGHFFSLAPHRAAVGPLRNACISLLASVRVSDKTDSFEMIGHSNLYPEEMALGAVLLGLGGAAGCMKDYQNFDNDTVVSGQLEKMAATQQESRASIEPIRDVYQKMLDLFSPLMPNLSRARGLPGVFDLQIPLLGGQSSIWDITDNPLGRYQNLARPRELRATLHPIDGTILQLDKLNKDADTLNQKLAPYHLSINSLPDIAGALRVISDLLKRYNELSRQLGEEQESLVHQLSPGRFLLQVLNDEQSYGSYLRQHAWSALRSLKAHSYLNGNTKYKLREAVERAGQSAEENGPEASIAAFEVRLPQKSSPGEMMYLVQWAVGNLLALQDEQTVYQDLENILREVYERLPDAVAFFERYPLKLMPLPLKNQLGYYRERGYNMTYWTRYTPPKDIGKVHHRYLTVSDLTQPNSMGMVHKLLRHRLTSLPVLYHEHLHYKGLKNEAEVWLREHIFLRSLIAKGAPENPELLETYVWESLETFFPGLRSLHPEEPVFPVNVLMSIINSLSGSYGLVSRPQPMPQDKDPFTLCFLKTDLTGNPCFQALNEVITSCYGERLDQQAATLKAERTIAVHNSETYQMNRALTWAPHIRYPRLGEPETREVTKRLQDILVQRAMQCNTLTESEYQKVLAGPEVREQLMAWEHFRERAEGILNPALERFTDLEGFVGRCLQGFERGWDYFVFKG